MGYAYGAAHAINAITTQADVRMKKVVQTRFLWGCVAVDVYGPNPRKNAGTYPFQKTRAL